MDTDEINCIEHFLVIKMEQPENNQTTQAPDVETNTCQTTPMQEWKNKTQSKTVICHLQCNKSIKIIC